MADSSSSPRIPPYRPPNTRKGRSSFLVAFVMGLSFACTVSLIRCFRVQAFREDEFTLMEYPYPTEPRVCYAREDPINDVMMVDPLKAKRFVANQLKQLKAKEKFQRRRQVEAINGSWGMIGLTAGLVIESQTGKGILGQLGEYLDAVLSFFIRPLEILDLPALSGEILSILLPFLLCCVHIRISPPPLKA